MKKILMVFGGVSLAMLVLVILAFTFMAVKGTALDKESKQYADSGILAIVGLGDERASATCQPGVQGVYARRGFGKALRDVSAVGQVEDVQRLQGHFEHVPYHGAGKSHLGCLRGDCGLRNRACANPAFTHQARSPMANSGFSN
jgi:hypothetical protein